MFTSRSVFIRSSPHRNLITLFSMFERSEGLRIVLRWHTVNLTQLLIMSIVKSIYSYADEVSIEIIFKFEPQKYWFQIFFSIKFFPPKCINFTLYPFPVRAGKIFLPDLRFFPFLSKPFLSSLTTHPSCYLCFLPKNKTFDSILTDIFILPLLHLESNMAFPVPYHNY